MKKIRVMLLAIITFVVILGQSVKADEYNAPKLTDIKESPTVMYYCPGGTKISNQTSIVPMTYICTGIYDIKSSNPKVATAKVKKVNGNYRVIITIKKTGKVRFTYKIMIDGKGSYESSSYYHFKKYQSPIKSITIGKKNLTKKYKKSIHISGKPLSGRLKLKLKKGWEVIDYYTFDLKTYGNGTYKEPVDFKTTRVKIKKDERFVIRLKKGEQTMNIMYDAK